ncbi:MAG: ATP synthase F1 subunit gamma [Bacteriovoracales bacterium]
MANVKELKKKIKSTKSTLKITSAMKLVSAAKLAKSQHLIVNSRPYSMELENAIKTAAAIVSDYSHSYLKEDSKNHNAILLVISSDKGLCGGYNSQMIKEVRKFISKNHDKKFKVYFIGKKAKEVLSKEVNLGKHFHFEKADPTYKEIDVVAKELAAQFEIGEIGSVYVAFNLFKSAISFTPTFKKLLPMTLDIQQKEEIKRTIPFDFKYEPGQKEILDELIPKAYVDIMFTSILDAAASEHGSRMAAMDNAASNCKDIIRKITLKMNKLRQAAITTELIEVISGAESLKA